MTKAKIIDRAIAGLPLDGATVARVSRNRRGVTLRHAWDRADGRAQDAVRRAAIGLARGVAIETGRTIELYSSHGDLLEMVEPEE